MPDAAMYEAYFGLTNLPFCLAPDSRFYVDTATHRAALHALQQRFAGGDEFVPLIGEFGTGKTLVGRQLLEELDRTRQVGAELSATRIEGDALFDRVSQAFGLPRDKGVRPLESAIRQFEGLARGGRDALLLVDDAHQLDAASVRRLRKLTAIRVEGRAALRVCLAGRSSPGFEDLQRFSHPLSVGEPVRLDPLGAAETHAYVLGRLRRAGWRGRPDFAAATAEIDLRCGGNPARINRLCGHILLHLYMQGREDVSSGVVGAVDDLLQAELRGEFATLELPPPVLASALAVALRFPAQAADSRLPGDAVMARLLTQATAPAALPDAAPSVPPVVAAAPAAPVVARQRNRLARGVTAVALMVTGGFLWQMISNFAFAHPEAPPHAVASPAPDREPSATEVARTPATPAAEKVSRED